MGRSVRGEKEREAGSAVNRAAPGMHNLGYSTPLVGCGGTVQFDPSGTWRTNLTHFFQDIYISGIRNITPTTVLAGFGGDIGYIIKNPGVDGCGLGQTNLQWWPAAPYPFLNDGTGRQYGWLHNQAYNCAATNNVNFVGWQNIYTVIAAVLQAANAFGQPLNVEEFDLNNETQLQNATVLGRLIVDNTHSNEDVLYQVRQLMANNGFSATQNRVTYSVTDAGGTSTPGGCDCPSTWGDSARILLTSELTAAIGGALFGNPVGLLNTPPCTRLLCTASPPSTSGLIGLPKLHTQPTIIDMHTGPCLVDNSTGNCLSSQTQNTAALESQTDFTDTKAFLDSFCPTGWRHNSTELCNALYMQGEVPVYQPQPSPNQNFNCDGSLIVIPAATVQGFNSSNLSGRRLPDGTAGVIFRPWTDPTGNPLLTMPTPACYGFPQTLQPTFVPTP